MIICNEMKISFFRGIAIISGLYSLTILKNGFNLILQIILYLKAFESNTTCDWLNLNGLANQKCVTFKF